jgi:hypothetical protein
MVSFHEAFANSSLDVVLADASITFPYDRGTQGDDWLAALNSTDAERSVAFFGQCPRKKSDYVQLTPEVTRRKVGVLSDREPYGFQRWCYCSEFSGRTTRPATASTCILVARTGVLRCYVHIVRPNHRGAATEYNHLSTAFEDNFPSGSFPATALDLSPNHTAPHSISWRG